MIKRFTCSIDNFRKSGLILKQIFKQIMGQIIIDKHGFAINLHDDLHGTINSHMTTGSKYTQCDNLEVV